MKISFQTIENKTEQRFLRRGETNEMNPTNTSFNLLLERCQDSEQDKKTQ